MDILDILLDILLKPPQPFIGLFLIVYTPGSYLPLAIKASELSVGDMGTVATSFNRSRYTTLLSSTPQSYKRKVQTLYVYLLLDVCHYLAERRASMFPLDNLTKVSMGSFSEVYFYFGRSWWS